MSGPVCPCVAREGKRGLRVGVCVAVIHSRGLHEHARGTPALVFRRVFVVAVSRKPQETPSTRSRGPAKHMVHAPFA
eukprot:879676-Rhodomonas_salina.2